MEFTNTPIPVEELPTMAEASFKQLEKQYLKVERITFYIGTLSILALGSTAFTLFGLIQNLILTVITIAVFLLITLLWWVGDTLSYNYSGYALREKDVLYRHGWFIQRTRIVPINRILHVSVQSGPIERKYHLASVSLFTAGAGNADFTIKGITEQTANQIRDWLTEQMNGNKPTE